MNKITILGLATFALVIGGAGTVAATSSARIATETTADNDKAWGTASVRGNWDGGSEWTVKNLVKNEAKNRYEVQVTVTKGTQFYFIGGNGTEVKRNWEGITTSTLWNKTTDNDSNNFKFKFDGTYTLFAKADMVENGYNDSSYGCGIELDTYVYYLSQGSGDTNARIYTWDGSGNEFYDIFPGTYITQVATETLSTVCFADNGVGEYKIYKIPVNSSVTTNFKFAVSNSDQGNDKSLVNGGAFYWSWGDATESTQAPILGKAVDFLFKAEKLRLAVPAGTVAEKTIYSESICGLSQDAIDELVADYKALGDSKSLVDSSYVTTYVANNEGVYDGATKNKVYYSAIMAELEAKATPSGDDALAINAIAGEKENIPVISLAIAIGSIVTCGGLFLLRKRKAE